VNFLYTEGPLQQFMTVLLEGHRKYATEYLSILSLATTLCSTLLYSSLLHACIWVFQNKDLLLVIILH